MRRLLPLCLCLTLFCAPHLFVCGQEVETRDGVRIVHNTKALWGKIPKLQLEKIRTMGDLDTTDEHVEQLPDQVGRPQQSAVSQKGSTDDDDRHESARPASQQSVSSQTGAERPLITPLCV